MSKSRPSGGTGRLHAPHLLLASALLPGCAAEGSDALAEPRALQFTPARTELPLRLVHHGDGPLPLVKLRIDQRDADWSAFTITDEALPRQIEPGGAVTLHLRVDADHFTGADHRPRSGAAALTFIAGGQPQRVPLRFAAPETPTLVHLLRLGLLVGLTAAGLVLRRGPWTWIVFTVAAVAIAPLGAGLCLDPGAAPLTVADLQQCADGRGGIALQMLPHPEGLGLLIALLLFLATRSTGRPDDLHRPLVLALVLFAAATAGGSLDPLVLMQAQHDLHWGLWQQPLGALALLLAGLGEVQAARSSAPRTARIAAFGLAAVFTTLCLGGPDLPGLLGLPHPTSIAAGLAVWTVKVVAVAFILVRAPHRTGISWAIVPLVLAQLVLTALQLRGF